MTQTTAEQMRRWTGPALFSFGFRPFFLLAGLWATIAMILWIGLLAGGVTLPTQFDPVTWHVHEFLFGYLSAVIAGFLLTSVPNWTGRLPVVGWSLAWLSSLWILGRVVVALSVLLPKTVVAIVDSAFLFTLCALTLREIIAGKKWGNLPVVAIVAILILANLVFHIEAAQYGLASQGYGIRIGLSAVLVLVMLIGGKITPSFTRNWLVKHGDTVMPTPPMQRFDKATLVASIVTLAIWTLAPHNSGVGLALIGLGVLHSLRLARWKGHRTLQDPLVWVLHAAYAFVPLGAFINGMSILHPAFMSQAAALHIWTAGAIGLMTLGVMTRASLGHSGRALHVGVGTTVLYVAIIASTFLRLAAEVFSTLRMPLLEATALFWIVGFGGFAVIYGRLLMTPKIGLTPK